MKIVDMTAGRQEDDSYRELKVIQEIMREILQDMQKEIQIIEYLT
jgi:hypothetical protein